MNPPNRRSIGWCLGSKQSFRHRGGGALCQSLLQPPHNRIFDSAAEHSTITAWQKQGEEAAYRNRLDQFAQQGGLLAVVSDSYDLWNAVDQIWGDRLKQQIIDSGATLVIRPDSGNPVEVVSKSGCPKVCNEMQ